MNINFYEIGLINDQQLSFAVINAYYKEQWVYVRHGVRHSWEVPGGRREQGEKIEETARRELFEETGCKEMKLYQICDYSLKDTDKEVFGRLYFATIKELGPLPDSEIEEIKLFNNLPNSLTYPDIQPFLFEKTKAFMEDEKIYERLSMVGGK